MPTDDERLHAAIIVEIGRVLDEEQWFLPMEIREQIAARIMPLVEQHRPRVQGVRLGRRPSQNEDGSPKTLLGAEAMLRKAGYTVIDAKTWQALRDDNERMGKEVSRLRARTQEVVPQLFAAALKKVREEGYVAIRKDAWDDFKRRYEHLENEVRRLGGESIIRKVSKEDDSEETS